MSAPGARTGPAQKWKARSAGTPLRGDRRRAGRSACVERTLAGRRWRRRRCGRDAAPESICAERAFGAAVPSGAHRVEHAQHAEDAPATIAAEPTLCAPVCEAAFCAQSVGGALLEKRIFRGRPFKGQTGSRQPFDTHRALLRRRRPFFPRWRSPVGRQDARS